VDIDLTYLPIEPRDIFLDNLSVCLQNLSDKIAKKGFYVEPKRSGQHIVKLLVSNDKVAIKIEPNTLLRGSVFEPEIKELVEFAQSVFLQTQKVKIVSIADLYGGKICAALDRQHPRDLFDIKLLFDNEGITAEIRQAFVAYLACSPRPMNELLAPNKLEFNEVFQKEFIGMTNENVSYSDLHNVRNKLIKTIQSSLLPNEKEFLISIKTGEPVWDLMPLHNLSELPGIRWKILNIQKMDKESRLSALEKLKKVLDY
jgi:predicted nucleotidyltransferase component of viral defense system